MPSTWYWACFSRNKNLNGLKLIRMRFKSEGLQPWTLLRGELAAETVVISNRVFLADRPLWFRLQQATASEFVFHSAVRKTRGKCPLHRSGRWEGNIKMYLRETGWGWEVNETGSGSCPMADFGISDVEHPGSVTIMTWSVYGWCRAFMIYLSSFK